ncbi:MAG: hypothetical protein QF473_18485, partial [Planctomycetota bacterium]|nr:hypothetical protein [Planctomycetota bacterium]
AVGMVVTPDDAVSEQQVDGPNVGQVIPHVRDDRVATPTFRGQPVLRERALSQQQRIACFSRVFIELNT